MSSRGRRSDRAPAVAILLAMAVLCAQAVVALDPVGASGGTAAEPTGGDERDEHTLDLRRASDVDVRDEAARDPDARECQREVLLSDVAQDVLFAGFEIARASTRPMPWERERRLGERLHRMMTTGADSPYRGKVVRDPRTQRYIEALVEVLAGELENRQIEFEVTIVEDDQINAFAAVGGYVYVTTGLLDGGTIDNEAKLVAVLAHEIAHVDRRHTSYMTDILEQAGLRLDEVDAEVESIVLGRIASMAYSRELEDEADRYAYERLIRTGYSPFQMEEWFWSMHRLEGPTRRPQDPLEAEFENLFASHSSSDERACALRRLVRDTPPPERTYRGRENLRTRTPAQQRVF